jgi:hypothetical protein
VHTCCYYAEATADAKLTIAECKLGMHVPHMYTNKQCC